MVIVRRNANVTESWDELLTLPEEEAFSRVTPLGTAWVGPPGSQETLVVELTTGDYLAVCFIPAGMTVTPGDGFVDGTGQPHFMLGMRAEFSVG